MLHSSISLKQLYNKNASENSKYKYITKIEGSYIVWEKGQITN